MIIKSKKIMIIVLNCLMTKTFVCESMTMTKNDYSYQERGTSKGVGLPLTKSQKFFLQSLFFRGGEGVIGRNLRDISAEIKVNKTLKKQG